MQQKLEEFMETDFAELSPRLIKILRSFKVQTLAS